MNPATHPIEPEEVMALHDGELEPADAARVEAHLHDCTGCQALSQQMKIVSQQVQAWQQEPISFGPPAAAAFDPADFKPTRRFLRLPALAWQLGAVAASLLLVALLSLPNLLRSRISANETSAVSSLRTINTVSVQYASTYGGFPQDLSQLGPGNPPSRAAADLIDAVLAAGTKNGYRFNYTPGAMDARGNIISFSVTAVPLRPGDSGARSFYADESGVIRFSSSGLADVASAALGGQQDSLGLKAEVRKPESIASTALGPMIVRSASLVIIPADFDSARSAMEQTLRQHGGYIAQLSTKGSTKGSRSLLATIRVPAPKLDSALADLKKLGRVESESLSGEEVTKQHTDLVSRQVTSRSTEKRLAQILENRTGKVADVLEVEREVARVRQEIEQMTAEQKALENQVSFATVQVRIQEEYEAQVNPPQASAWLQIRNAAIEGYRSLLDNALTLVLLLLSWGPALLFWVLVAIWPARKLWRKLRTPLVSQPNMG